MAGKSGFMKDAFILFAITLISGIALGGVYEVTKGRLNRPQLKLTTRHTGEYSRRRHLLKRLQTLTWRHATRSLPHRISAVWALRR